MVVIIVRKQRTKIKSVGQKVKLPDKKQIPDQKHRIKRLYIIATNQALHEHNTIVSDLEPVCESTDGNSLCVKVKRM